MSKCDICKKYYKNAERLSIHKIQRHNDQLIENKTIQSAKLDKHICKFCTKEFARIDNYKRHLMTCKVKKENDNIKSDKELEQRIMTNKLIKLMEKMIDTKCKMDYREFNKLRKRMESSDNNVINNVVNNGPVNNGPINGPINNGPVNNGTINNINIIAFGDEKLAEIFTDNEKKTVLNEKNNALTYLIEYVHFNERYPQFNNIIVTNNRANEAYIFDKDMRKFKLVKKNNLIEDLLDYRTCDIEDFFYELQDHLDPETRKIILKLAEHRGDDDSTREQVKLLLFNNKDKVKHLLK